MPLDDKPNATGPASPELEKAKKYSTQASLALELPFTIVGGVLLGSVLGYFLDHWLHAKMIFTFILGGVGFYAGLREVLRRLDGTKGC
jgi:F0F1-type ATP synthase assembly protein I